MHWSPSEKAVARRAFDRALKSELDELIQKTKSRVAKITDPAELWKLEAYLRKRREEIDDKYDYRYSVLIRVFASLVAEGRLSEEDLRGLGEEKLKLILGVVGIMSGPGL